MDHIRSKIAKLLALSESPNEHEAAAAARLAHRLMERHAIDEADLRPGPSPDPIDVSDVFRPVNEGSRIALWRSRLARCLAYANGCSYFTAPGRRIAVVGRPSDRARVSRLYLELSEAIDAITRRGARGRGRAFADAYRLGIVSRIADEIAEARREAQAEARAAGASTFALSIVDTRSSEAQAYARSAFNVRSVQARAPGHSGGFASGRAAGAGVYGNATRPRVEGASTLKLSSGL